MSAAGTEILRAEGICKSYDGRAIIRDVNTLEPLPPGQVGLVELITPLMTATPILAVMTDDLGVVHPGGS